MYGKFKLQYTASTEAAHAKLMNELRSPSSTSKGTRLGAVIIEAWTANGDAAIAKERTDRLAAALRAHETALLRRFNEMAELKKEMDRNGQPSSKETLARRQATQVISALRSIADFRTSLLATVDKEFAVDVRETAKKVMDRNLSYEEAKRKREALEKEREGRKAEFERMRNRVLSIGGLDQSEKDKEVGRLKQDEIDMEGDLAGKIDRAKQSEADHKEELRKATEKHESVRRDELASKTRVTEIAGRLFREVLEDRQRAVREYERAITFIGNIPSN